ncbi:MAG TPA: YggS family pyridoxal phosphate-dependent enzyme, partial [Candidatus Ornithospirochaeta stercorigallinarum]|nr:YggS family pyridoxal phosphate-dependent enzyme [Candidatus Ornithospirochaeta stercorigallinarum]
DDNVFLLPVSKTKSYDAIMSVYSEGARVFGENRVQEVERKFPSPEERPDGMKVYLIGQLQKNKVRKAVYLFDRIESVDSLELLSLIDKESAKIGKKMDVLLEYNSSKEENKSGFRSSDELLLALRESVKMENISVIGIMTIGPLTDDPQLIRNAFKDTKALFGKASAIKDLSVLSMGMSSDYLIAIEEGSTEVRIGSAIFGERR